MKDAIDLMIAEETRLRDVYFKREESVKFWQGRVNEKPSDPENKKNLRMMKRWSKESWQAYIGVCLFVHKIKKQMEEPNERETN